MEVMGLMLGEFVDDYTVRVVDVFAMPQSGTGVSVEAVDPVFQTKMLDMLKQVGRSVQEIPELTTEDGDMTSLDHKDVWTDEYRDRCLAWRVPQCMHACMHPPQLAGARSLSSTLNQ